MTLDACAQSFRSGRDRVLAVLDGLMDAEANRKPAPDVWSALEVVAHLNRLAADYLPALERAYAAARAGTPAGDLPLGIAGGFYVRFVGPEGREMKTFASMTPPPSGPAASALDAAAVRATFESDTERFLTLVDRARRTVPVRVGLPEFPALRLRGVAVFAGLAAHVHRHAAQMERRAAASAPAASTPAAGPAC